MKLRLALLLAAMIALIFGPLHGARAEGIGAYFTVLNTYFYLLAPKKGGAILVRPRLAFTVVDLALDDENEVWYEIVYPGKTVREKGLGWTPRAPHELVGDNQDTVLVYSRIPENGSRDFSIYRVPISGLELLNESQTSRQFAQLDWQKVRFQLDRPLRAWAKGSAGIYRAGKTETFISRVFGEMVTRNVKREKRMRLLSGVVRIGDTLTEVGWALGDPLRSQTETVADTKRTTWQYPEVTVTFENEVVKTIE